MIYHDDEYFLYNITVPLSKSANAEHAPTVVFRYFQDFSSGLIIYS